MLFSAEGVSLPLAFSSLPQPLQQQLSFVTYRI